MPKNPDKKAWSWLWVSLLIVLLDQLTKYGVSHSFQYGEVYSLNAYLNIWLQYNAGAAYGMLSQGGGWQTFFLASVSMLVSLVLFLMLSKTPRSSKLLALGLSLVLGGAIGNLIDRLRYQYVIDFIDFHVKSWHFATFNIADAAITVGAACLLLHFFCRKTA